MEKSINIEIENDREMEEVLSKEEKSKGKRSVGTAKRGREMEDVLSKEEKSKGKRSVGTAKRGREMEEVLSKEEKSKGKRSVGTAKRGREMEVLSVEKEEKCKGKMMKKTGILPELPVGSIVYPAIEYPPEMFILRELPVGKIILPDPPQDPDLKIVDSIFRAMVGLRGAERYAKFQEGLKKYFPEEYARREEKSKNNKDESVYRYKLWELYY